MVKNFKNKIYIIILLIYAINSEISINLSLSFDKSENNIKPRKLNSEKKNLIIGAITNYSWDKVRNFFISMAKIGFKNCDFVFYVGNVEQEAIEKMRQCGVIVYDIPEKYMNYLIKNFRFKIYEDYLNENKDKYNMVFHADVKDTVFQKDIFELYEKESKKSFFHIFYEDGIFRTMPLNKEWARFYCGNEGVKKIIDKTIICSGTILATADKFVEFCHDLWKTIEKKKAFNVLGEQGYLNCYIHYYNKFSDCLISTDNHGPLVTLALVEKDKVSVDKDDNILNYDGQIVYVAHQYNRMPNIVHKMNIKFSDRNLRNITLYKKNANLNKNKLITNKRSNILVRKNIFLFFIFFFISVMAYYSLIKIKKRKKKERIVTNITISKSEL